MIRNLRATNFTAFRDVDMEFSKGINVVIGSNGTGKSHVLKLAYTIARWSQEMALRERTQNRPDKATLQKELARKLTAVFLCEGLGRLSSRGVGVKRTEVEATFYDKQTDAVSFSFSTKSTTDAVLDRIPEHFFSEETVFFPTKEMLSMFPGFTALYRDYALQIDETYYDLCLALEKPLPKGPKLLEIKPLLQTVEKILHGSIELRDNRFYLKQEKGGDFEIHLVAEGFRKLGTVSYLLANGALSEQSILFWDEPETNLNPTYMIKLAELLVAIARNGTQVFIATHSLFMMRELSLLLQKAENITVGRRFFALETPKNNVGTSVSSGESAEQIEPISALDAEIDQSQRFIDAQKQEGKNESAL